MSTDAIRQRQGDAPGATAEAGAPGTTSRRRLLHVAGGAGLVVLAGAAGGLTWRAADQGVFATGEGPAYAAWDDWRAAAGGEPLRLVRAAVLAASGHNTQPWLFRVEPERIDLLADASRSMGNLDPLNRERDISLGCALENLLLAAGPNGFMPELSLLPDADEPTFVARVELAAGATERSPLYDAIPNRHTNRGAYAETPVEELVLSEMADLNDVPELAVVWLTAMEEMERFAALTVRATMAINADEEQSVDSFAWWRGDWDELQAQRDGITIDAAGLSPLMRTVAKMAPDISRTQSDEAWLDATRDPQLATAAAFGMIVARDHDDIRQRLQTGRLWQRLHLWATVHGLAMQPLNQVVERRDREEAAGLTPEIGSALAELMPEPGWHAMMPFRLGYPSGPALRSPRRPASEVLA